MASERNPFPEEDALEDETEAAILLLLAKSIAEAVVQIKPSEFNPLVSFDDLQQKFRNQFSGILIQLNSTSQEAIQIGIDRISKEFGFSGLSVDFSDERFSLSLRQIFNENLDYILSTNREMWSELRSVALENGWSDEELARRLKKYYGLTPSHLATVLNMESALISEGVKKKQREAQIQRRIDRLLDWRYNLIAGQLSTATVEGSKDESFGYLIDTSQIDRNEYEKRWVSVIDDVTTDTCITLHNTRAPIGGTFRGGIKHPPSYPPVHRCRSAVTLAKRIL